VAVVFLVTLGSVAIVVSAHLVLVGTLVYQGIQEQTAHKVYRAIQVYLDSQGTAEHKAYQATLVNQGSAVLAV
jgi:putative heme degradation protein